MAGNSQRRNAGSHGKGNTAGSGGRIRRGLKGKGPTPKAEDRPYHRAHKAKQASERSASGRQPRSGGGPKGAKAGADWVVGRNAVLEALQAEIPVRTAYLADGAERDDRLRDILRLTAERSTPTLQVARAELDRLSGGTIHQGVALQLPEFAYAHPDDLLATAVAAGERALVVALDSVTDPRNLGAVVRSAAAFGASGVLLPERRAAGMSAAAWKTSAGAAARIPIARATNLNRALRSFADAGFALVGLAGEGADDLAALPVDQPLVLVVGSEGEGLSRLVRESCDHLASIPITGMESLNASVAAGIALYEVTRQRG